MKLHVGTCSYRRTSALANVMTSSVATSVYFFMVFIFAEAALSAKITKNLHPVKISCYTVDTGWAVGHPAVFDQQKMPKIDSRWQ